MVADIDILTKAALLHDIGKICLRANRSLGNHSEAGVNFLSSFLAGTQEDKQLLRCVKLHHSSAMREAHIAADDISYLVYEADNIAAGADRRSNEGADKGFDAQACLQSVFNIFGEKQSAASAKYHLRGMNPADRFNYPCTDSALIASADKYQELVDILTLNFQAGDIASMSCNELLRILEDTMSYVPSSTSKEEVCDISLFVHSKVTAAVACCLYQYLQEKGIFDYRKCCFAGSKDFRKEQAYLLVSGDFSGIQSFIYNIPSHGALKSLRGRSFYLELFMENYIDELLSELHLSRANLLYNGGGHFYILVSNTEHTRVVLKKMQAACNSWLLENFGSQLYVSMGQQSCSADDFLSSDAQHSVFAAVNRKLERDKLRRYDKEILSKLFDSSSAYNKNLDDSRECSICHMSSRELINDKYGDICPSCRGLYDLGKKLFESGKVFVVLDIAVDGSIELFSHEQKHYLAVLSKQELKKYETHILRIYTKNEALTGSLIGTRLWLADYVCHDTQGRVLTFEQLADVCCDEAHGIKRLGVLRADVDDLGAAFVGGFMQYDRFSGKQSAKYATLARYADLSRDFGLFFKLAVAKICKGELQGFESADYKQFSLFGLQKVPERKVHVVYSGGDDMFLVGAWDDLLELAVDIRRAFARFTDNKLSFSAGLALFTSGYPISRMAELTGMLESAAKNNDKDSIALFGFDTEQNNGDSEVICQHVYHWQDFTQKVCVEKLRFLQQYLDVEQNNNTKLKAGKTMLYKLLNLLEGDEDINIARFAYTLGRLQPENGNVAQQACYNKFSEQMYKWFVNREDRKQLITALNLLIYYLRDAKEE